MKALKKILLIIVGIILSLVILEIGLQLAGFTLITIKKYQNKVTKDPNTITILCLGESTTDGQWPPILQNILNKKSNNKKFNVIDEGHAGTNSSQIVSQIQKYIFKYNPDIVITMMGINDNGIGYMEYKIKIYNFFILLVNHIKNKFFANYTNSNVFSENMQKTQDLTNIGKYEEAEYIFTKILKQTNDPFCYSKFLEMLYISKQFTKLEHLLEQRYYILHMGIDIILKYFYENKKYSTMQIQEWMDNNISRVYINDEQKKYYSKLYNIGFKADCDNFNNEENFKPKEIKNIDTTKNVIRNINYKLLIENILKLNKNILIFPMQYPTLSLEKLKEDLKDSKYYDKLIFISNEENFSRVLEKYKTEEVFRDMFGGSFGHCTDLGNTLIAENIAETILNLYDTNE